jgi:hypothetical protein
VKSEERRVKNIIMFNAQCSMLNEKLTDKKADENNKEA